MDQLVGPESWNQLVGCCALVYTSCNKWKSFARYFLFRHGYWWELHVRGSRIFLKRNAKRGKRDPCGLSRGYLACSSKSFVRIFLFVPISGHFGSHVPQTWKIFPLFNNLVNFLYFLCFHSHFCSYHYHPQTSSNTNYITSMQPPRSEVLWQSWYHCNCIALCHEKCSRRLKQ